MKRAWPALATAGLGAALPLLSRSADPAMLRDSDTAVLLRAIAARNAPFSWFGGDWPLFNHFYRPLPTLAFEADRALWGANAAGFGLTNALLVSLCVLALYWFVREATDRPLEAGFCALLGGLWTVDFGGRLSAWLMPLPWLVAALGLWRHGLAVRRWGLGFLLALYLTQEIAGLQLLWFRTVGWLPGRTASVMTVFALGAMAAYARWERLGAARVPPPDPGPLDPPATRNTRAAAPPRRTGWLLVALVLGAGAFASYEQSVMLPALVVGTAVWMRLAGTRVRWGAALSFWGLLVGYVLLRRALVPSDASGYQLQQFRAGPGVWLSITDYLFPVLGSWQAVQAAVSVGPLVWVTEAPWRLLLAAATQIGTLFALRRAWAAPAFGWLASTLAFLPMAWLKPFEHYHLWPMLLRTILVVGIARALGGWIVSAGSRPERTVPPRPRPAPGSLPRP